jgi:hypothetical protein
LDCIADRRRGNPGWRWSNFYKEYPTGEKLVIKSNENQIKLYTKY